MYSVVLMMALSGGADAPACFGHGGGCCGGGYACSCSGYSCHGGGHRLFGGHGCCGGGGLFGGHGCCGGGHGMFGGHGCCGGGGLFGGHHGCCGGGGLFGGHHRGHGCCGGYGCCGGAYACSGACTGVAACTGCGGGAVITPGPVQGTPPANVMPNPETIKPAPKKAEGPAPATIIVSLPENATLTVDGNATKSTSASRRLITPALEMGNSYVYTLRATFNGQVVTQDVEVRGGETSQANFSFTGQGVASR
jgi:uncharacterized protein (TIGR03000 family)